MATKADELLGLSDEDFANLNGPPEVAEEAAPGGDADPAGSAEAEPAAAQEEEELTEAERAAQADDGEDEEEQAAEPEPTVLDKPDEEVAAQDKPEEAPAKAEAEPEAKADEKAEEKPEAKEPEAKETSIDYKAAYEAIMAPFKANGKMIELKSPEEVVALMQQGANYTRKMQDIQPHRKVLTMLQNNDLLDEGKLSFLIDLDKKNPEAIQKLIKDSGIDPLDIDVTTDPTYLPGDHQVTDEEVSFRSSMDDLKSTPEGTETLGIIHGTWDNDSKRALWNEPGIMSVIHEQRASGVYDLITAEVDRRKMLGQIPANTPFLQAYKTVGDSMVAEVEGQQKVEEPAGEPAPQVIETKAAVPKSQLANGDKAKAASTTRAAPKTAKVLVNPLSMSDEEFAKLPSV